MSVNELLKSFSTVTMVRVYDGTTFFNQYSADKEKWTQLALEGELIANIHYPSSHEAIWERELALPHVGNGSVFLTWQDGEAYLLDSSAWVGQGIGDFSYQVFSLDATGNVDEKDSGQVSFSTNNFLQEKWEDIFSIPDMLDYTEQITPWIEESTVIAVMDLGYDPLVSRPGQNYTMKPWEIWKGFLETPPTGMGDLEEKLEQTLQDLMEEDSPDLIDDSPQDRQALNDSSITLGHMTIALYESKQDITAKLNETDLSYNEYDSNVGSMGYNENSDYNKYDSYYIIDYTLCVYFKDSICVRLRFLDEVPQTARGIHKGDSYSRLIEQYGDSYEKHTYAAHGLYNVYRYISDDYICEFGILEDYPDSVHDVDIYVPSLYPIYDEGEEIIN